MAHTDSQEPPATERSLRNPRRRNRVDSESVKVAPRRKRSKITENTFIPRGTPEEMEAEEKPLNGHDTHSLPRNYGRHTSASLASDNIDMPMRGPKNSVKRATRADSARVLTQNENYSVKLLPSTPKELQREGSHFRGSISSGAGLALAITRERAHVWDYNGQSTGAGTKSIDLPFPVDQHDPLPFGAFVTTSGSADLGVLVVSATTGRLVYHESIDRLTTLGFFQERKQGVEGTISGLFTGETVVQLVTADPAGFVVLLTSGRVVHITLRDAQGKAKISSQFLCTSERSSGGLFGSIKNILGAGAWKQAVSTICIRQLERGQVQVLGLLEKGELRTWDLDWSGRYDFRTTIDFREQLQHELRQMYPAERHGAVDHLTLLDVAVIENQHSSKLGIASLTAGKPLDVVLLVRCGYSGDYSYALVELSMDGNKFDISRILQVEAQSQTADFASRPQLLIPTPSHTAFVLLPDTVAIVSLATIAINPEAQFHEASYIEPSTFQDAVYLRQERAVSFTGADIEPSRSHTDASCVAFVDGAGLVRISTRDIQTGHTEAEQSIKSRIEQAVFYGYQDNNILDLLRASPRPPADEDVEQAALAISQEILSSSPLHFDMPPTSVSANLQKRAEAAKHLAAYLQKGYPDLSTRTKWQLMEHAEKIQAGLSLWHLFETNISATSKGRRKATLLHEVCEMVRTRYHFDSLWPQSTPDDIVRTFFVTQVASIARLLPWSRAVLESVREDGSSPPDEMLRLVSEADDIWLRCMDTAFDFRKEHASAYGIPLRMIENDTAPAPEALQDVPQLWTSSNDLLKEVVNITKLSRDAVQTVFEEDPNASPEGVVKKIATENAQLVNIMCLMHLEHISWTKSRGTEKYVNQAQRLIDTLDLLRNQQIRSLAEVGQTEASIVLAEKYRDMRTLTEVLIAESQYLSESVHTVGKEEEEAIRLQIESIFNRITRYFDQFGQDFSEAFFGEGFSNGQGGQMLSKVYSRWTVPITKWLQREPERAKICWINDVIRGKDFKHAGKCLYDVALDEEENVWNKKVELSLAKLTKHAFLEDNKLGTETAEQDDEVDNELAIIKAQEYLHEHVRAETSHSLDDETAVQDAMDSFCGYLSDLPVWNQLMRQRMTKLLLHQALTVDELIDLLSLVNPSPVSQEDAPRSNTAEALQVVDSSHQRRPGRTDLLTKLIWKRAYLREDWNKLNALSRSESEQAVRQAFAEFPLFRAITMVTYLQPDGFRPGVLLPSETKDAGCHVDDLPSYIPHELREACLEENIMLERQLETMMHEQRIESWAKDMLELAKDVVAGQQNDEPDSRWALDDTHGANGHLANGEANGIKTEEAEVGHDLHSIDQTPGSHDDDDDVQML